MTKIPKQQTTWSALDFLENSEQETNAQKSELERRAELRRKLAAAKKPFEDWYKTVLTDRNNKKGGSIKRNNTNIKSTFFAKDGLPGGMQFMDQQPSSIISNIRQEIAKRAYNNIVPRGYNNALSRIWRGIILNEDTSNGKLASTRRDALAAQYFQIPEDQRHSIKGRKNNGSIHLSEYKPRRGNQNEDYYALDLTNKEKRGLIRRGLEVPIGKTYQVREKQEGNLSGISGLQDFGISRGYDNKGEYISYTDFWDLSPISLNPFKWITPGSSNHDGLLKDPIGKPFNIYDRIYLDDYYNVPDDKKGATYLQELTVTPNKVSAGFYSPVYKKCGDKLNYLNYINN